MRGPVRQVRSTAIVAHSNPPGWSRTQISDLLSSPHGPASSIPAICRGFNRCRYQTLCSIENPDEFQGNLCPIERRLVAEVFFEFVSSLEVGPRDYADQLIIWSLVRLAVQARRLDARLQGDDVIQHVVAGVDYSTGQLLENLAIHPAVDAQQRISKTMLALLSKMVATRKDKLDAAGRGQRSGMDPMALMAGIRGYLPDPPDAS